MRYPASLISLFSSFRFASKLIFIKTLCVCVCVWAPDVFREKKTEGMDTPSFCGSHNTHAVLLVLLWLSPTHQLF